jgi:hypothetical protein
MSRREAAFYLVMAALLLLGVYAFTRWMSQPGAG